MSRKKAIVTPEDVEKRTLFTLDGVKIYRCIQCETEPKVTMMELGTENVITEPVSFFKGYIRNRWSAELPTKPARDDKGGSHQKRQPPTGKVDISKIQIKGSEDKCNYEGAEYVGNTLKGAIAYLFAQHSISEPVEYIKSQPDCENKVLLLSALES
jgi:hypothetical protein